MVLNRPYRHEVRAESLGHVLPPDPASDHLSRIDGYLVLNPFG